MWGVGLIVIALITFVVISTVSNVVTTNQQDYEFMKSSVEAAMHDAIDETRYRRGICVCSTIEPTNGVITMNYESDYEIFDPNDKSECDGVSPKYSASQCKYRHGEYIINPDVFTESLISRFGTVAKTGEKYDITVQDVIPYPPKVSVRITYYQYFNSTISDDQQRPIVNQMDAILEGGKVVVTRSNLTGNVKVAKINCKNEQVDGNLIITDIATGETKNVQSGTQVTLQVGSYNLTDGTETVPFTVDPNDISEIQSVNLGIGNCTCNEPEKEEQSTTPSNPSNNSGSGGNCNWHYDTYIICTNSAGQIERKTHRGTASTCGGATSACRSYNWSSLCSKGYTMTTGPVDCGGKQNWVVTKENGGSMQFTKTCSGGSSCSNYTPYESCKCRG